MARGRQYSAEVKARAVRTVLDSDRPIAQVAKDLDVGSESLRTWVRQARTDAGAPGAPTSSSWRSCAGCAARTASCARRSDAGVGDRVSTRAGSFLTDDLGEGYDVVLLFEIVHNHPPEENAELIARAARALRPDGVIVILEDVAGEELEEHNAAFSLAMFACSGDRTYTLQEIEGWLTDAGLVDVHQTPLPASVSLVVGSQPASRNGKTR
jgi:transposase-like protein